MRVVDPVTNATDTTTLRLGGPWTPFKWSGIAHSPATNLLYCAPFHAPSVLVINPVTNTTDNVTLSLGLPWLNPIHHNGRRRGIVAFNATGKLYCAPFWEPTVLIIDPVTNTTALLAQPFGYYWCGLAVS